MSDERYPEFYYEITGEDRQPKKNGGYLVKMKCHYCKKSVTDDENSMVKNINGNLVYVCGDCQEELEFDEDGMLIEEIY